MKSLCGNQVSTRAAAGALTACVRAVRVAVAATGALASAATAHTFYAAARNSAHKHME